MATSSKGSTGTGSSRSYGGYGSGASASSLFDAAFSKPPVRRPPAKTVPSSTELPSVCLVEDLEPKRHSPSIQVFSPPVSLPESTSSLEAVNDDNASSHDSDEEPCGSQSQTTDSQRSLTNALSGSTIESPRKTKFPDFEDDIAMEPAPKKAKSLPEEDHRITLPKQKVVYRHKWTMDEEEDDGGDSRGTSSNLPKYRLRNIKEPHQCLESGEYDDFKQDLEYILSALKGTDSVNVKCLSCISLARKCISPEFRHFIRSEKMVNTVFKSLSDASSNQCLAICAATVVYLMCRDIVAHAIDSSSLKLFSQLIRMERPVQDSEVEKHYSMVWDVFETYLDKMSAAGKHIKFDNTKETITPSSLILEALVFVTTCSKDEELRTELLNQGTLQWIVAKVDRVVSQLTTDKENTDQLLIPLERCFRILESCMLCHKKNQAFLISHRGSLLITTCGKMMCLVDERVRELDSAEKAAPLIHSLSLMARMLTNLSHENELCSTKLGQTPSFLSLCLSSFTFLSPKYAAEEKKSDLILLMSSLLVNLVERCNANRRKIIETKVPVHSYDDHSETQEYALTALTRLFVYHEKKAQESDTDIEKELTIEEPDEPEEEEDPDEGKLDRKGMQEMSELDMINAIKGVLNKASSHMEDSVMASHFALLIGCILQQNEDAVRQVADQLPDRRLRPMIEQLQRYVDFLHLAGATASLFRAMEKIIDLLERLD